MNLFECANSTRFNMRLQETRLSCLILCCFFIACAVLIVLDWTMLDRNRRMIQTVQPVDLTPITVTLDVTPMHTPDITPIEAPSAIKSSRALLISNRSLPANSGGNLVFYFAATHSTRIDSKLDAFLHTSLSPHRLKCHLVQQRA